jgi:hypothetical protein
MDWLELRNPFDSLTTEILRSLVERRLRPYENLDDAILGGVSLAAARADLAGRDPYPLDAEFTLSLWCWWPLKPKVPESYLAEVEQLRQFAFSDVTSDAGSRIAAVVREDALALPFEKLYERQRYGDISSLFERPF